ncbi:hypothetical protein OAM67_01175 [bacterium]|nr:hypothetical protein [bacterium]
MCGDKLNFKNDVGVTNVQVHSTGNDTLSIIGVNSSERVSLTGADIDYGHSTKTGNYTMVATDVIIGVDTTSSAVTITLPPASACANRKFFVVDEGGNAGTNNITVARAGSDLISGATSVVINGDYNRIQFYSNGTNFFICGT